MKASVRTGSERMTSTDPIPHPPMTTSASERPFPQEQRDIVSPPQTGDLIAWLDTRMGLLLCRIETTGFWRTLTSPSVDHELLSEMMKQLHLELVSYQADSIQGAITAIAHVSRSMPVKTVKMMLSTQADRFGVIDMALRDYVALGGDEAYARDEHRTSPAAFAVASLWKTVADQRDPFSFLGALYPVECLTPIVAQRLKAVLRKHGFPASAMESVEFLSDPENDRTLLMKRLIQDTVYRNPGSERSIKEGLDRLLAVYPIPVWTTAYERAVAKWEQKTFRRLAA
jgi:hypothetical protein